MHLNIAASEAWRLHHFWAAWLSVCQVDSHYQLRPIGPLSKLLAHSMP